MSEEQEGLNALCKLADLDSVTKALQRDSLTLCEAIELFDAVMQKHLATKSRLDANSTIVEIERYEEVICKIQAGQECSLVR